MKKLIGLLSLFSINYSFELPVTSITGSFTLCLKEMLQEGEVMIWNKMEGYERTLQDGNTNELCFIWDLPENIIKNLLEDRHSIKLRFQYRIQNLITNFKTNPVNIIINDHDKNNLSLKILDELTEDFTEEEISLDIPNFSRCINNNNQYILHFKTNTSAYKHPEAAAWSGLSISTRNTDKTIAPTLVFE